MKLTLKTLLITVIVTVGLILIAIFQFGLSGTPVPVVNNETQSSTEAEIISSDPPQIYKKEKLIVGPDKVITLNFSTQLLNAPETKVTIKPEHDVDIKLSDDYKSIIITPKSPYKLGEEYTILVSREAKLREEGKILGKDYNFNFNIINYSGI